MKPGRIGAGAGVGGSLAYLLVVVPTEWLTVLPLIPETHFLPIIAALGTVLSAGLIALFGINGKRKSEESK